VKLILQRVSEAAVRVDNVIIGSINAGLLILFCAERGDTPDDVDFFMHKAAALRIFSDENGKTNLSVRDVGGSILVVSQFTLAADWRKGNRPGFSNAADPESAKNLYELFCQKLRDDGLPVETGIFAADMDVSLINDGPFTIILDSRDR